MPAAKRSELIVKAKAPDSSTASFDMNAMAPQLSSKLLNDFLRLGLSLKPISKSFLHDAPMANQIAPEGGLSEIGKFFKIEAPEGALLTLLNHLNNSDDVEAAYVKPPTEPAFLNSMQPATFAASTPATSNFRNRQHYLDAAPTGIDVQQAWNLQGGKGAGISIIDIEWGWRFTHEDLKLNQGGILAGPNSNDDDHGTAVLGVFGGDDNNFGVVGISPDANVSAVSLENGMSTSEAIVIAANKLKAGDIILLEVHRGGPSSHLGNNQFGYIGIEWWPDDFAAIRYAVQKGIVVVEAAGNGGQNLDAAVYNTRPNKHFMLGTFPPGWTNPFNMANPQSGAVIVGAGMPPAGTHGRNSHPDWGDAYQDRGRCFFSNFGARVDAQGWGWEVTTTGYGDLQGGVNRDAWYTDQFSGTSSASPIIVGTLACLQGILKAQGHALLSSPDAIQLLRASGSPQQDAPTFTFTPTMTGSGYPQQHPARPLTQRIGNRPNLQQLIIQLQNNINSPFSRAI